MYKSECEIGINKIIGKIVLALRLNLEITGGNEVSIHQLVRKVRSEIKECINKEDL